MTLCCMPVLLANLHQALPSAAPPCCCKHTRNFPEHISSLWKTISNSSGKFQGSASERRRTRVPHFPKLMWPLKLFSLLWIRNTFSHKLPPKKTFLQLHATKDRSNIKEVTATGLRDRCLCIFLLFKVNDEIIEADMVTVRLNHIMILSCESSSAFTSSDHYKTKLALKNERGLRWAPCLLRTHPAGCCLCECCPPLHRPPLLYSLWTADAETGCNNGSWQAESWLRLKLQSLN